MARNRRRRTAQSSSNAVVALREENRALAGNVELLEETLAEVAVEQQNGASSIYGEISESIADVVLRLDDLNWRPIGSPNGDSHELPLQTIRNTAIVTRGLLAINPLIKRGIALRCAYIFGGGVTFKGIDQYEKFADSARVKKYLLSTAAQTEMESALGTDGNFFLLVKRGKGRNGAQQGADVQRLPLQQIWGVVTDPDDPEDIWFYKRQWYTVTTEQSTALQTSQLNVVYYPAIDYDDKAHGHPRQLMGFPVDWNSRIAHHRADGQTGWQFGSPDLLPVIFWAKAHKEFLENQASLVKAYSRFAFKVTAPNIKGVSQAAQKVAAAPSTNQLNGDPNGVGATAVLGGGATISALGRTGGSVDFEAGTPLAGYVAAGLSVPLHELLNAGSESNRSAAESLSTPTVRVMRTRQEKHEAFYDSIFDFLGMDIEAVFPQIDPEAIYRAVQAVTQAADLYMFSAKEIRQLLIDALQLDSDDWDPENLPTEEELGNLILEMQMQKQQITAQMASPEPGAQPAPQGAGTQQAGAQKKLSGAQRRNGAADLGSSKKPTTARPSYGDNSYRDNASGKARTS